MEEGELKLVLRGLLSSMKVENDDNGVCINTSKRVISYVIPHFEHLVITCLIQVAGEHSIEIDKPTDLCAYYAIDYY